MALMEETRAVKAARTVLADRRGLPSPTILSTAKTVPGDISNGSHSYEPVLMETADNALEELILEAKERGKVLRSPVVCRVIVEAYVDDVVKDCDGCRNGVHSECVGSPCGCYQRTCDRAANLIKTNPETITAEETS